MAVQTCEFHKSGARLGFLWNVMDRETRFLLAAKLTEERDRFAGIKAFKEAIANAKGQLPNEIRTDAWRSYPLVVSKTMPTVKHVAKCGVRKSTNNNRIERLNGTLRERIKVQRGWKTVRTPLAEGKRIQYNFVKPHIALNGKTPAYAAGLNVNGWNELLKQAVSQSLRSSFL